ncbi:MAG TPA: hypothetical protein VH308_01060 [Terracidiphilus sp.]|nr:hypothetical protein [Terracidiphilus sp.]
MFIRAKSAIALVAASLISPLSFRAQAQDNSTRYEIGVVYYAGQGGIKALDREKEVESGRKNYSAKVNGAHATMRLAADKPQVFRVCKVDPTRFKLYRFKSEGNARTCTIAKINIWIGGSKNVLAESEIPMSIQTAEDGCFTLTPQKTLEDGEFGFSPFESSDVFMFGVGSPQ